MATSNGSVTSFRVNEAVTIDLGDVTEEFAYREPASTEIRANEVSDSDLRVALKNALTKYLLDSMHARSPHSEPSACSCYVYCDIMHVFDESVVYWHAGKSWSVAYSLTDEENGSVEISGESSEVRPITKYVAAEDAESIESDHSADEAVSDESDENDGNSDPLPKTVAASESLATTVLKKIKQLLKADLTSDVNDQHTSEVEQRSSEKPSETSSTETDADIEENTEMAQENKNQRAEAIAKLVANEHVAYTDADAEWLAELSETAFERISTLAFEQADAAVQSETEAASTEETASTETVETQPATETAPAAKSVEVTRPKTAEEYIASLDAPKEITRMFERAIETEKALRTDLVKKIKANSSNKFSEKQLNAMDTDMLESIASLATPTPDYSGTGDHTVRRASTRKTEDETVEPIRMPSLSFGLGSRRNGQEKRK